MVYFWHETTMKKYMNQIQKIISFEVPGIVDTITNSTSDYYIKNYAIGLKRNKYPDENESLLILTEKLLEWYDKKIADITKNQYMYSLELHNKTIEILRQLHDLLSEEVQ